MKKNILLLAAVALVFGACNNANNDAKKEAEKANKENIDTTTTTGNTAMAKNDADFLVFAANVGNFEIKAAELAEKNSTNKSVKDFAQMMIKDHTTMGGNVTSLAAQKKVTLPSDLSNDMKDEWNKLDSLKGKKFDEEYVDANVKGHNEAISKFEQVANDEHSTEVKQLATTALPQLREHKQHAEMLQSEMTKGKK